MDVEVVEGAVCGVVYCSLEISRLWREWVVEGGLSGMGMGEKVWGRWLETGLPY